MSRLVTSGDTISNFGKYLPAPYIDKIYISDTEVDGQTCGTITADVYVYLRVAADADASSLAVDLENLKIYVLFAVNIDDIIEDILAGKKYMLGDDVTIGGASEVYRLNDFTETGSAEYDDSGNKIIKYYKSVELTSTAKRWPTPSSPGTRNITSAYAFAWSLAGEHGEGGGSLGWGSAYDSATGNYDPPYYTLNSLETSDISYETIFENGSLIPQEEIVWIDDEGGAYGETPLQSISSKYYKAEKISHSEIVDSFQELIDQYEVQMETDAALKNIVDQISYILSTSGEAVDLLPQLNLLRRVFPSKSSATTTGNLYLKYREKIYTANAVIETDDLLSKKIVSNSKIIDSRDVDLVIEEPPARVASSGNKLLMTSVLYDDLAASEELFINKGFIFHDYTSHVASVASIGNVINLETLLDFFPVSALYQYFYPIEITLSREGAHTGLPTEWTMTMDIDDWTPTPYTTSHTGFTFEINTVDTILSSPLTHYVTTELHEGDCEGCINVDSLVAYSFCTLRNFVPYNPEFNDSDEFWSGNYRLLCIEFQELQGPWATGAAAGPDIGDDAYANFDLFHNASPTLDGYGQVYRVKIEYADATDQLLVDLIGAYAEALEGLTAYYEAAQEACVYNSVDGRWNEKFIEEMHNTYDGDPGSAPWLYYPTFYNIHREILSSEFGGDYNKLEEDTADIVARISPDTGNLSQLEYFVEAFAYISETIFSTDSEISEFAQAAGGSADIHTGATIDAEFEFGGNAGDLPEAFIMATPLEGESQALFSDWASYTQEPTDELDAAALEALKTAAVNCNCDDEDCKLTQSEYWYRLWESYGGFADETGFLAAMEAVWPLFGETGDEAAFDCLECHDMNIYYVEDAWLRGYSASLSHGAAVGFTWDEDTSACVFACTACKGEQTDYGQTSASPTSSTYDDAADYGIFCPEFFDDIDGYDHPTGDYADPMMGDTMTNGVLAHEYFSHCCMGEELEFNQTDDEKPYVTGPPMEMDYDDRWGPTCYDEYVDGDTVNDYYKFLENYGLVGETSSGTCVLGGTLINTSRGQVPVETLTKDDEVYAYNFEKQEFGYYDIVTIHPPSAEPRWATITTALGYALRCSDSHPLIGVDPENSTQYNKLVAKEIEAGATVYVYHENKLTHDEVVSVEFTEEKVTVYNFEVEHVHKYISDNILSHNKAGDSGDGGSSFESDLETKDFTGDGTPDRTYS